MAAKRRSPALKLDPVLGEHFRHLVDRPECPFCGVRLADMGVSFVTHTETHASCRAAWEAWKERITEDWHGGD